jgi:glycosyltransferase involved in cell wall biosynthesis
MGRFKVVIVIPAYNEEDTINQVIKSTVKYGDTIVVNDSSSDSTAKKALEAGAIVINHAINKGYDQALNSGFIEADKRGYDAVITFDADGQHSPAMLTKYIDYLTNGKDLVLGIRPKTSNTLEWLFMLYTRVRFNWKDPLCGMKGYSMKLYKKQGYFDSYKSVGTELSIFGLVNNYSYVQLEIDVFKRKDKSRFYSAVVSNWYLTKSLFRAFFS